MTIHYFDIFTKISTESTETKNCSKNTDQKEDIKTIFLVLLRQGRDSGNDFQAEILETTFCSRFCFRFLKYPLFTKVVSFRVPEI